MVKLIEEGAGSHECFSYCISTTQDILAPGGTLTIRSCRKM